MTESTDPYLYPGTDVLRNLRDIRDLDILARFEAEATARRLIEALGAGYYLSEINAIHPFREGNGRLARLLASLMALQAGLPLLDFGVLKGRRRQEYFIGVQDGLDRNYSSMEKLFGEVIERTLRSQRRRSSRFDASEPT